MPSHIRALPKPKPGSARAMQRARARLAKTQLAENAKLVRERDGDRCRVCGSTFRVQVHHIVYRSRGGSHEPSNLVCLCGGCHDDVHSGRIRLGGNAADIGWAAFTERLSFDAKTPTNLRHK